MPDDLSSLSSALERKLGNIFVINAYYVSVSRYANRYIDGGMSEGVNFLY